MVIIKMNVSNLAQLQHLHFDLQKRCYFLCSAQASIHIIYAYGSVVMAAQSVESLIRSLSRVTCVVISILICFSFPVRQRYPRQSRVPTPSLLRPPLSWIPFPHPYCRLRGPFLQHPRWVFRPIPPPHPQPPPSLAISDVPLVNGHLWCHHFAPSTRSNLINWFCIGFG